MAAPCDLQAWSTELCDGRGCCRECRVLSSWYDGTTQIMAPLCVYLAHAVVFAAAGALLLWCKMAVPFFQAGPWIMFVCFMNDATPPPTPSKVIDCSPHCCETSLPSSRKRRSQHNRSPGKKRARVRAHGSIVYDTAAIYSLWQGHRSESRQRRPEGRADVPESEENAARTMWRRPMI